MEGKEGRREGEWKYEKKSRGIQRKGNKKRKWMGRKEGSMVGKD